MKKYLSYNKNRIKVKGGVATVLSNYLQLNAVKVAEGRLDDEYIITRFDHVVPAVNIINIYGQQESRTPREEILESWLRLREDLVRIANSGEAILIGGDLSRAVGSEQSWANRGKPKTKVPVGVTDNVEDIDRALIVKESKRMEEEVLNIKSQNLGRVGSIFKMKEVINGPKKGGQVPTAIRYP